APQSAFGFLALDDGTVQVRLSQGSLNVRVRDLSENESLEIDTPTGAVALLRPGVYRVDVDSTGDPTSVTVRRGEAEVTASGFAPFHYGRWVYVGNGWAWVPGHMVARPVYAPALVVFVGGHNWSVAIGAGGGGGVAWFPLAPEEPYVPPYHVSNTYIRNVNVTNVTVTNIQVTNVNVTNINYRNRRAPDAVTVVSHDAFVQSRPVNRSVIVVARDRLDQARVVGFAARVTPTQQSGLAQPTGVEARRPP